MAGGAVCGFVPEVWTPGQQAHMSNTATAPRVKWEQSHSIDRAVIRALAAHAAAPLDMRHMGWSRPKVNGVQRRLPAPVVRVTVPGEGGYTC